MELLVERLLAVLIAVLLLQQVSCVLVRMKN